MRYMLLISGDPTAEAPPDRPDEVLPDWVEATRRMHEAGVLVAGDGLHPVDSATTVRHRGGDRLVTDGPFAETKEHLLGFYLVDVPDLDAAMDWAGRMPCATWGSVEVQRAALDAPRLPPAGPGPAWRVGPCPQAGMFATQPDAWVNQNPG